MPWALIPIIAIIAWAVTEVARYRSMKGASGDLERLVEALGHQLDEAEAERTRLRQRIENLEAIVTSEHYELERQAQHALDAPPSQSPARLPLDDEAPADSDEDRTAQMARRLRES